MGMNIRQAKENWYVSFRNERWRIPIRKFKEDEKLAKLMRLLTCGGEMYFSCEYCVNYEAIIVPLPSDEIKFTLDELLIELPNIIRLKNEFGRDFVISSSRNSHSVECGCDECNNYSMGE